MVPRFPLPSFQRPHVPDTDAAGSADAGAHSAPQTPKLYLENLGKGIPGQEKHEENGRKGRRKGRGEEKGEKMGRKGVSK